MSSRTEHSRIGSDETQDGTVLEPGPWNCTEEWRLGLKVLSRGLRPAGIAAYRPLLETKSYALLSQVLANPNDLEAHLNRFVAFVCRARPPVYLSIVPTVQPVRIGSIGHGVWL